MKEFPFIVPATPPKAVLPAPLTSVEIISRFITSPAMMLKLRLRSPSLYDSPKLLTRAPYPNKSPLPAEDVYASSTSVLVTICPFPIIAKFLRLFAIDSDVSKFSMIVTQEIPCKLPLISMEFSVSVSFSLICLPESVPLQEYGLSLCPTSYDS